jgi:hypothetical protein
MKELDGQGEDGKAVLLAGEAEEVDEGGALTQLGPQVVHQL